MGTRYAFAIKGRREWREWLDGLRAASGAASRVELILRAVRGEARRVGYRAPEPRRLEEGAWRNNGG